MRFTAEGSQAMAAARKEIKELEDAELAPPDLKARLTAIVDRLETVVDTELVPADGPQTEVVDGLGTSDATEPGEVGQRPVAVEVEGGSAPDERAARGGVPPRGAPPPQTGLQSPSPA